MSAVSAAAIKLTDKELHAIAEHIHATTGIKLDLSKRELIQSRLGSRIRSLGLASYGAYLTYVDQDTSGQERTFFVDALTTNLTYFFREDAHFWFYKKHVVDPLRKDPKPLKVWSAGCSSGEEPHTLAMVTLEALDQASLKKCEPRILATDLSTKVLARAKSGQYPLEAMDKVPEPYRRRFLREVKAPEGAACQVSDEARGIIRFGKLNLMGEWPMRGPFDVIFCRNVMIYFDQPTKERLVARYKSMLRPGGYFFISLAETLNGLSHTFRYVQPGVYQA